MKRSTRTSLGIQTPGTSKRCRFSRLSSSWSFLNWIRDSWWIEYGALFLSTACLITIFILALHFNNQPSDLWHSSLSINTILSIIVTVLKSSTLLAAASALGQLKWTWYSRSPSSLVHFQVFDSASRGPFGAFLLLWNLPRSFMPCIGSFIMILSLGLDAATQASISQPSRTRLSPSALVPVTTTFNSRTEPSNEASFLSALYTGICGAQAEIDHKVDNNISNKYMQTTTYNITPICSTGNCDFESYASLGVQHSCTDITNTLRYSNGRNNHTASLPISPTYSRVDELSMVFTTKGLGRDTEFFTTNDTVVMSPAKSNQTNTLPMLDIFIMVANETVEDGIPGINERPPGIYEWPPSKEELMAFRCRIDLGMKLFTGSVRNGEFTETPLDFFQGDWTFEDQPGGDWSGWELKQNVSGKEYVMRLGENAWTSFTHAVEQHFDHGSYTSEVNTAISSSLWAPATGVSGVFASIDNSLNIYFRTVTGQSAQGMAETGEEYIRVQWAWLLVPLALVVLNIAFVVSVRLQTHRLGLASWKNSSLALMLGGLNEESWDIENGENLLIGPPASISCVNELEIWVRKKTARLRSNGTDTEQVYKAKNDSLECLG